MKTILIAIPTSKYIEPETFKSIYDQIIPSGYKTEFQFFGEVDLNQHGRIASNLPAWTYSQLIDDLEYDIRVNEINLQDTSLGPEARGKLLSKSKEMKERLA